MSAEPALPEVDPFDASLVLGVSADSPLGVFNRAGLLAPADVHVARRLARIGEVSDDAVLLATAFAVRAPRVGHVRVDLGSVRRTVVGPADVEAAGDLDVATLPWPEPGDWMARVASSPLVAVGDSSTEARPLRLVGSALYLDRYWQDERSVAADLAVRAAASVHDVDPVVLAEGITRLFPGTGAGTGDGSGVGPPGRFDEQRWASAAALLGRLTVIAGGPGTGKTTTVARIVALLVEQALARGSRPPLVALAAPTGKAAARMEEAVRAESGRMRVADPVRASLGSLRASTIHRLLGATPWSTSHFRHGRHNRLPEDVVIVDETSMLSLWLMTRLVESLRPEARLVLVGDPEQLVSVEAGAVLGDIVGPASGGPRMRAATVGQLSAVTGLGQETAPAAVPDDAPPIGDHVVVLRANHRFRGNVARLAEAIGAGSAGRTLDALSAGTDDVEWCPTDPADPGDALTAPLLAPAVAWGAGLADLAGAGDGAGALAALGRFRLLCAHRRGPFGVRAWNQRIEAALVLERSDRLTAGEWYLGRPTMLTANDYTTGLFNGDTGVVVAREGGGVEVAFQAGEHTTAVSTSRLTDVDTVYAMTIHKAQGSEFDEVVVVLPESGSRLLTRELLYTAVTRARDRVTVVGSEEAVVTAVGRPIARASGLATRLWEEVGPAR